MSRLSRKVDRSVQVFVELEGSPLLFRCASLALASQVACQKSLSRSLLSYSLLLQLDIQLWQ
jgi:hypothetical protein